MKSRIFIVVLVGLMVGIAFADGEWDVSLADFPRRAGETDDTARLQRAVDATGAKRVLLVPRGLYEISRTITVTNGTSFILHKSATVCATAKMSELFHIDRHGQWPMPDKGEAYDQGPFFRGGHLDGNGLASCLFLNYYFHFTIRDVVFNNGFPYGFHVGPRGAEIIGDNLYFRTLKRGLAGNIALFSQGHDSYYSHVVVVDYTTGIKLVGSANALNHCHVWGGPVPPPTPGRLPEMLENSVCFDIGGAQNTLRDSYADTGAIGFKLRGWELQILGCWFINNAHFGLKDITIVDQEASSSNVLIADCVFTSAGPRTKIYRGPGNIRWRDIAYRGFTDDMPQPGALVTGRDCPCKTPDEWEFVAEKLIYTSPAGEFAQTNTARALTVPIPRKLVQQRFPQAGAGTGVVFRVRATTDATQKLEFSIRQADGLAWGAMVPLTRDWREVRLAFDDLHAFKHWLCHPFPEGVQPDARKIREINFMYGNWISGGTVAEPHGFEIDSLRIVGR